MKLIETKNAVGHVLCHDITQIIKGRRRDRSFAKGILSGKRISRYFYPLEKKTSMYGKSRRECSMKMKQQKFSEISAKIFT